MKYVALLRGIGPTNPAMRNENLRRVVAGLGHRNVETVISSGNVLFESNRRSRAKMEGEMEAAWPARLGFRSTTIIRSREQLETLVRADPYRGLDHGRQSYLLVTFFKQSPRIDFDFPLEPADRPFRLLDIIDDTLFTVADTTGTTPDLMAWLERTFGKQISSRTWPTVQRLLSRM